MKTCTKCKIKQSINGFRKDRTKKDGLYPQCKICCRKYQREYRQQHLQQEVERCRRYYKSLSGYIRNVIHGIKNRCYNPKIHNYHRYGGRGIKLEFTYQQLFDWCIKNNIDPRGLQIDRINNSGNYNLNNIRFVTAKKNVNNRG